MVVGSDKMNVPKVIAIKCYLQLALIKQKGNPGSKGRLLF